MDAKFMLTYLSPVHTDLTYILMVPEPIAANILNWFLHNI